MHRSYAKLSKKTWCLIKFYSKNSNIIYYLFLLEQSIVLLNKKKKKCLLQTVNPVGQLLVPPYYRWYFKKNLSVKNFSSVTKSTNVELSVIVVTEDDSDNSLFSYSLWTIDARFFVENWYWRSCRRFFFCRRLVELKTIPIASFRW